MSTTTYREQSRVFLAQAWEEFERGDLRQASEKGWGAASQIVKAAADARGWEHNNHNLLFRVVRGLVQETGDPEILRMFAVAGELHSNFYDELYAAVDVEMRLREVMLLVEKVDALLPGGPNGDGRA